MSKKKIYNLLVSPFSDNLIFFILLFLLSSSINFISRSYYIKLTSGIYWSLFGYCQCYVLCLPLALLKGRIKKIYKILLLTLGSINFIIDIVISSISSHAFEEFVGLILGTNMEEVLEFFQHYVSLFLIFVIILIFAIGSYLYKVLLCLYNRCYHNKYIEILGVLILLFSIPLITNDVYHHNNNIFIGKLVTSIREYNKNNHDLKDFYSNVNLTIEGNLPQNVVVVIGESFAKDFSSLYGYNKTTNPKLSQYSDKSLVLFNNVESADIATIENIEYIMSTYRRNSLKEWYECPTLVEILSKINYKTYWVSNQAEVGLWDNIPAKYASLCDSVIYVGPRRGFYDDLSFDEKVIPPVRSIIDNDSARKVIFIHLMGSHSAFEKRYPQNRSVYNESDYKEFISSQREVRAYYDNSIIYNDSVVNEIFKLGDGNEAIFFYFPDHGLDVYETDQLYVGHGRRGNLESELNAKKIPFMIYTTSAYQLKNGEKMNKIYKNVEKRFVTEDFIYSLMDILNVKFKDNSDVEKYSLFN